MNIAVFGSGYVGLVASLCFCRIGHHVSLVDIDQTRLDKINQGIVPFYEPGLSELLRQAIKSKRFIVGTDPSAVSSCEVVINAVGTPKQDDAGSTDLSYVYTMLDNAIPHLKQSAVIVNKSTVPVGTGRNMQIILDKNIPNKKIEVVSNPEFLKEGNAVNDFLNPDRVIIGAQTQSAFTIIRELYSAYVTNNIRIIEMDINSAELTKYAANCMLATKISFMNDIANYAKEHSADIDMIRIGIGSDHRIGTHFIHAGCGYGGSCFPKDVDSLIYSADALGIDLSLLKSVRSINQKQKQKPFDMANNHFMQNLKDKVVSVWGLSFKPETDDVRESPAFTIISKLIEAGAHVNGYDPVASKNFMQECKRANLGPINLFDEKFECIKGSDALIVCTEWKEFHIIDNKKILNLMNGKNPLLIDARNIYNPTEMKSAGFSYQSIGRN